MAEYDTVAIIGAGLIGGSIGLALRERKLAQSIIGIGRRQASLDVARDVGAIDHGETDIASGVSSAQLIVVATPVDKIAEHVIRAAAAAPASALITDAGSTKEQIVSDLDRALADRRSGPRFVGSHPLAGDHRTGAAHARADLFDGRTVIITPTAATRPAAVTEARCFWEGLGANVLSMPPAEHDAALAVTSHLPHLAAVAVAASTPRDRLHLTASGWRDVVRIAGGDPQLWEPIFAANKRHVIRSLDNLLATIGDLRQALDEDDVHRVVTILEIAAKRKRERDALGD